MNEAAFVSYFIGLQQLGNRVEIAFTLARRSGMPGAGDLSRPRSYQALVPGDYKGTATVAAQYWSGRLRTPQTLQQFGSIQAPPDQPSPILRCFITLSEHGKLKARESRELGHPGGRAAEARPDRGVAEGGEARVHRGARRRGQAAPRGSPVRTPNPKLCGGEGGCGEAAAEPASEYVFNEGLPRTGRTCGEPPAMTGPGAEDINSLATPAEAAGPREGAQPGPLTGAEPGTAASAPAACLSMPGKRQSPAPPAPGCEGPAHPWPRPRGP